MPATNTSNKIISQMFSAALNRKATFSAATSFCRFMSTNNNKPMRAYPAYTVYGADCYFNLKVILPKFRTKNNVLYTDGYSQNGSLLLEWVPRGGDGALQLVSCSLFIGTKRISPNSDPFLSAGYRKRHSRQSFTLCFVASGGGLDSGSSTK